MRKFIQVFSSIKLTIAVLLCMGGLVGYATLFETDPATGGIRREFYRSWGFLTILTVFGLNLLCCTLKRAPFKIHQIGYVTTHCGLMIILIGSMASFRFGREGNLRLYAPNPHREAAGPSRRDFIELDSDPPLLELRKPGADGKAELLGAVAVPPASKEIGTRWERTGWAFGVLAVLTGLLALMRIWEKGNWYKPVPFVVLGLGLAVCLLRVISPPGIPKPSADLPGGLQVEVMENLPGARLERRVAEDPRESAPENPALHLELELNGNVGADPWLFLDSPRESFVSRVGGFDMIGFLPARDFAEQWKPPEGEAKDKEDSRQAQLRRSAVLLIGYGKDGLTYFYSNRKGEFRSGPLAVGEAVRYEFMPMPLKFKAAALVRKARSEYLLQPSPEAQASPGLSVRVRSAAGAGAAAVLLGEETPARVRIGSEEYEVSYAKPRAPLGFTVELEEFRKVDYPGTREPASYESDVRVTEGPSQSRQTISVNHPLIRNGYRLFQASFEANPMGIPITSIFAVAYDPGIPVVYTGFAVFGLGLILIFYLKPYLLKRSQATPAKIAVPGAL